VSHPGGVDRDAFGQTAHGSLYATTASVAVPRRPQPFWRNAVTRTTGNPTTSNTIARNDGGNWRDDGYIVGGQIEIIDAEDPANDGTFVIASVQDAVDGDLVVEGTPLTNNAADTTVHFAVDNRNEITLKLRVRTTPGDSNARTFAQANLAAAGETILANRLFTFGLAAAHVHLGRV